MNYIETYNIGDLWTIGISQEDPSLFRVWVNGCGTTTHTCKTAARGAIFSYVKFKLKNEIEKFHNKISEYQSIDEKLGNDFFFLGKFLAHEK
jgi:hypothetical protein